MCFLAFLLAAPVGQAVKPDEAVGAAQDVKPDKAVGAAQDIKPDEAVGAAQDIKPDEAVGAAEDVTAEFVSFLFLCDNVCTRSPGSPGQRWTTTLTDEVFTRRHQFRNL